MDDRPHSMRPLILAISAATLAIVMMGILPSAISFLKWARGPQLLPPTTVSLPLSTPDGSHSAQVWRHEQRAGIDGPPVNIRWKLQVTGNGQPLECDVAYAPSKPEDLATHRAVTFTLNWIVPGWSLAVNPAAGSSGCTVYFLKGGLIPSCSSPMTDAPCPLTEPLRKKLQRLGRPAAELDQLQFLQLRGGDAWPLPRHTFVNEREDVLLVLGPDFRTRANIVSRGPIILVGEANVGGAVGSAQWILVDDLAALRMGVYSPQVYVADSARLQPAPLNASVTTIPTDLPPSRSGQKTPSQKRPYAREPTLFPADPEADDYLQLRSRNCTATQPASASAPSPNH